MFKLEGGWVGQDQFERCSNLEIRTEKWTLPKTHESMDILEMKDSGHVFWTGLTQVHSLNTKKTKTVSASPL